MIVQEPLGTMRSWLLDKTAAIAHALEQVPQAIDMAERFFFRAGNPWESWGFMRGGGCAEHSMVAKAYVEIITSPGPKLTQKPNLNRKPKPRLSLLLKVLR